jgi:hypothetical protein
VQFRDQRFQARYPHPLLTPARQRSTNGNHVETFKRGNGFRRHALLVAVHLVPVDLLDRSGAPQLQHGFPCPTESFGFDYRGRQDVKP